MCSKDCIISSLEMLRDNAWHDAMKFRYDPLLGETHNKYLHNLNALIDHARSEVKHESIRKYQ